MYKNVSPLLFPKPQLGNYMKTYGLRVDMNCKKFNQRVIFQFEDGLIWRMFIGLRRGKDPVLHMKGKGRKNKRNV